MKRPQTRHVRLLGAVSRRLSSRRAWAFAARDSFIAVCVAAGSLAYPTWLPPSPGPSLGGDLLNSLFYIAFAYSGWNAASYAYDEFVDPQRTVPLAMILGCAVVGLLYLAVNYLFVANLTPAQGTVVFHYDDFASLKGQWDQVTLGQAVMGHLLGPGAARVMSGVMLLLFTSAISAMTLIGPRVYAAMAYDGVLPRVFLPQPGRPSLWGAGVQGVLALLILFTHELRTVLANVGAILTLFAALTCAGLFAVSVRPLPSGTRPGAVALVCAALYVALAGWMLVFRFGSAEGLTLLGWLGGVCLVALVAYGASRRAAA
jgi:basic amino acid/polyamine antiporter, APA family